MTNINEVKTTPLPPFCFPPNQLLITPEDVQAYATKARADLEAENKRLREALSEAADDIESWGAYADAYFQKKHDLEGCVAKARAALENNHD